MHHGKISLEIAQGLQELRTRIERAKIPPSQLDDTIKIATWNIREFGRSRRREPAIHYIAEIINEFDLLALTELRDKLGDLERVMRLLGPYWKVIYSDYITDDMGNRERIGYLYDERAVTLTGLAAEADPFIRKKSDKKGTLKTMGDWWRSPYMVSFRAGNFEFIMITVHIRYQKTSDREKPIENLADWVETRRNEPGVKDNDFIVAGDFNITSVRSKSYKNLTKHGLKMPSALANLKQATVGKGRERFDQIVHSPTSEARFTKHGGILDFYHGLDGKPDIAGLYPDAKSRPTDTKFTYQLSDHYPLWVQIETDIDSERFAGIAAQGKKRRRASSRAVRRRQGDAGSEQSYLASGSRIVLGDSWGTSLY